MKSNLYKPGQIMMAGGNLVRIKRSKKMFACEDCSILEDRNKRAICFVCINHPRMPHDCFLEPVKPKSTIG